MKQQHIILLGLIAIAPVAASAQAPATADTTIRATRIEITQIYRPKVKQADKELIDPVLPPRNRDLLRFDYEVPQYSPAYSYKPLPLQPLALLKDSTDHGFRHYIKLGGGNRSTIIAELGSEVYRGKYSRAQLMGNFLSQKGKIGYQQQSYGNLNGQFDYNKDKFSATVSVDALHRGGYQYGYDHDAFPSKIPSKTNLSGAALNAILSKGSELNSWSPELNVGLSYYTGAAFDYERSEKAGIAVRRNFLDKGLSFRFGADVLATEFRTPLYSIQNNTAALTAGVSYQYNSEWTFKANLSPTIGQSGNTWLLQDLSVAWAPDASAIISAGSKGRIQRNTYYELFLRNPFISATPTVQSHSNELYVDGKKAIGDHLFVDLRASFWQYENFATFVNAPKANSEQMGALYLPRVRAISLQGTMRYQLAEEISVGAHFALYNFTKASFDSKVWHTPNTRIDGDLLWHPLKALSVTAYVSYVGGNFAIDSSSISKKLKAYADVGVGAEWSIVKNISVFANINNLLNTKYERWLGYQAYGINLFGGIRLKVR